jgi:hypothetical protein
MVKRHIDRYGEDERIADCGSPTFRQVKATLFPGWEAWFNEFFIAERGGSCRGTSTQLAPPVVSESDGTAK